MVVTRVELKVVLRGNQMAVQKVVKRVDKTVV